MKMERSFQQPSKKEGLLGTAASSPETFDDLEASMLFLEADASEFRRAMIGLGKSGRTFSMVFVMDDLGKTDLEKKMHLRALKGILQDRELRSVVMEITVKGRPGEEAIEPNVFHSGVRFMPLEG